MSERPLFDRVAFTRRIAIGLVMLVVGALWTLDLRGVLDASRVLRWWPAAAVAWGLLELAGWGVRRHRAWGYLWLFVGAVAGLDALGVWRFTMVDLIGVFLLFVGGLLVVRAWRGARPDAGGGWGGGPGRAGDAGGECSGVREDSRDARVNLFTALSGAERRVLAQDFTGGEATAILGGLTLDLREARLAGDHAVLDLFVLWGGIEILAPPGWRVVTRVSPLLGAVVDSMPRTAEADAPVLELRGFAVMGGVDVRDDDRARRRIRAAVVGAHGGPDITVGVTRLRGRRRVDVRIGDRSKDAPEGGRASGGTDPGSED